MFFWFFPLHKTKGGSWVLETSTQLQVVAEQQWVYEFFGQEPEPCGGKAVLMQMRCTYMYGVLFHFLVKGSDPMTVRKGCQSILKEVQKFSLPLRECVLVKAKKALVMGR